MSVTSLHPEELLDKAEKGTLSEVERDRLDAHVRSCSVCRVEQAMRLDFQATREDESAAPFSAEMLTIALGSVRARPASTPPEPIPVTPPRRIPRWVLLAAAVCTLVTLAGAQRTGASQNLLGWFGSRQTSMPVPISARTRTATPAPTLAPSVIVPSPSASVSADLPRIDDGALRETPAALFDEVVSARKRGEYDRSIAACRRLQARHPASREAHVSRGTLGRLLLDRGDASGALASFDAYARGGGGELDEAVLVGRATALERLGRQSEAMRAWSLLLESFPNTPYAEQARAKTAGTGP